MRVRDALLIAVCLVFATPVQGQNELPDMVEISGGTVVVPGKTGPRKVNVSPFFIDRTEVTVHEYERCVKAGACERLDSPQPSIEQSRIPRVDLTPLDAQAYCGWRNKRLPTEAEWVVAAKNGHELQWYPWGNQSPRNRANFVDAPVLRKGRRTFRYLYPACSFPLGKSDAGVCDLAGNAAEWVSTQYEKSDGALTAGDFVVKGGSFLSSADDLRADQRQVATHLFHRSIEIGFRCAKGGVQ